MLCAAGSTAFQVAHLSALQQQRQQQQEQQNLSPEHMIGNLLCRLAAGAKNKYVYIKLLGTSWLLPMPNFTGMQQCSISSKHTTAAATSFVADSKV